MNNEQFDISEIMKEISPQFDKVVKELGNTLDVIGKVIKDNLDDSGSKSAPSSVDIPSTDKSEINKVTVEEEKSTLMLKDMTALLDVNDALERLNQTLTVIVGDIGIGSDGLMRELDKINSVIVNAAQPAKNLQENEPNEWIYELLEDKSIDNERKARVLLGLIER